MAASTFSATVVARIVQPRTLQRET